MKQLFKRTSTGAIQVWYMEVINEKYRTYSGKKDGALVVSEWKQAKPKNAGKVNATTAQEQAQLDVEYAYKKKIKEGYSETEDAAAGSNRFTPMLAQSYVDHMNKVAGDLKTGTLVFSQPKLNGVRCNARYGSLMSRKNTPILAVPHIEVALSSVLKNHPGLILDGELYNHDYRYNLNTIVSIVRKHNPTSAELIEASVMQYWVYDIAGEYKGQDVEAWSCEKRLDLIGQLLPVKSPVLIRVPSAIITDVFKGIDLLDTCYLHYLAEGYEGQMVRRNGPYARNSRSADLLKRKEENDKEFKLLNIVEGEGNRSGMAGYATVLLDNGLTCDSNITGDRDFLRQLLINKDKFIGGEVTVKFNGISPLGRLINPRIVALFEKVRDV